MKIVNKETIANYQGVKISRLEIESPLVAKKVKCGQFVMVMVSEAGERVPLTVVDKDIKKGTIVLIVQELGLTTKLLGKLKVGDSLFSLVGPLGHSTEIKDCQKVILVGGGVGIAEIYPVAKALKEAGNQLTTIIGARTKDLLILVEELKSISDRLYLTADDGSTGRKGFVTDTLSELLADQKKTEGCKLIYAVGPIPMMRSVALASRDSAIKTLVSLNALMVDGTGMCGCCRVSIGNETKFSCIDGPEFDGQLVNWDELVKRSAVYEDKEKHLCKLNKLL